MRLLRSFSTLLRCTPKNAETLREAVALYHSGQTLCAGQNWRLSHGQSRSGTEYGALTNTPDWSYVGGRPAPVSKAQKERNRRHSAINKRIRLLLEEMDRAKTEGSTVTTEDTNEEKEVEEAGDQTQNSR